MLIHTHDEVVGRDENDDYTHALCGKEVRLSDMKHWFGMDSQLTCPECLNKMSSNKTSG